VVPRRLLAGWSASLQALGSAFSELVRAELAVLGDDFTRSGRRLGGALLLLAAALFVLFWAIGLTVYLAVEVAHQWLPRWAAAAVVLAVVLLLLALLAAVGWRRLKCLEAPTAMMQRRWSSHRDWWLDQFPDVGAENRPEAGGIDSGDD
jgi:cytochrome c biogenesis protein CcdA